MIATNERSKCTGCTACASACPENCITMQADEEGFLYPAVDEERCIHCGICDKVCPAETTTETAASEIHAYAAMAGNDALRMKSSSGGVFSLLAEETLRAGGVVFGAVMRADCRSVHHVMAENAEDLDALRGSKYLQSDLEAAYCQAEEQLKNGRKVLFSGTPCQISGLLAFLRKEYDDLLCVEVICHGVPSPWLWEKYVGYLEKKHDVTMTRIGFRDKRNGWRRYGTCFKSDCNKEFYSISKKDIYSRMFLRDIALRPSCYQCPSKGLQRRADLTIADFWGIEKVLPGMNDDRGTSLVLVHSQKGREAFRAIGADMHFAEVDCEAAIKHNPAMLHSAKRPAAREHFYRDMQHLSFDRLAEKYVPFTKKERVYTVLEKLGCLRRKK